MSTKRPNPGEAPSVVSQDAPSPIRHRYVLADLLTDMTPEAMREAFDWGPELSREIVDD